MTPTIRFAAKSDSGALKHIWKICFGDSEAYINFFFEHCFCAENTVVTSVCNQVVGVVHMLPATLGKRKFMYGYAVGVLPEFRGHNLCEKMHDFIKTHAEKEEFIYGLHPANAKLYSYYRKIGLCEMFSLRTYDAGDCKKSGICSMQAVTPTEYYRLREESFSPLVSWNKDMISFMCEEATRYDGFVKKISVSGNERIMLGKKLNDTLYMKETTLTDSEILQVSGDIKDFFNAKRIIYTLPNKSALGAENVMILGFGEKDLDVYMNLFLD